MSFSKTLTLTDHLLNSIYCAIEIVLHKNKAVIVEFSPCLITIGMAERICDYLDDLTIVSYNFDLRRGQLTLAPLPGKNIFFIDDTLSGRIH